MSFELKGFGVVAIGQKLRGRPLAPRLFVSIDLQIKYDLVRKWGWVLLVNATDVLGK